MFVGVEFSTEENMIEKEHHIVYKTTCLVNGKIYIGLHSTDDLNDGYLGSGSLLNKAVQKYGTSQFKREILEDCSDRGSAIKAEIKWIDVYPMCLDSETGYNLVRVSGNHYKKVDSPEIRAKISQTMTGRVKSDEHLKKISESLKGRTIRSGFKQSDESNKKRSLAMKGKPLSEEHRKKISEGCKGRTITQEQRMKQSQALTGRKYKKQKHEYNGTLKRRNKERINRSNNK
jgi:group I intron endonuclease